MDNIFRPKGLKAMDKEIDRLAAQLSCISMVDPDYDIILDRLKKLTEAREHKNSSDVDSGVLLGIVANIGLAVLVLYFEQTGIITSKAFSWIKLNK